MVNVNKVTSWFDGTARAALARLPAPLTGRITIKVAARIEPNLTARLVVFFVFIVVFFILVIFLRSR